MGRSASRAAGLFASALLLAILLSWWGWCFLDELDLVGRNGAWGPGAVNPDVRDFLSFELQRPVMALHIGLAAGLAAFLLLLKQGDPARAIAHVLGVLHGTSLLISMLLCLSLVRWILTRRSGGGEHILLLSLAWWAIACGVALLYCLYSNHVIGWLFLATAAAFIAGSFKSVTWSAVAFGMKSPRGLSPWAFAAAMCLLAVCALAARLVRLQHRETMLWLAAAIASAIVQTWLLCCLEPFVAGPLHARISPSGYFWLNLPLHAGFIGAEVIMAYLICKRRSRLFRVEERAGAFPVVTKSEDASA